MTLERFPLKKAARHPAAGEASAPDERAALREAIAGGASPIRVLLMSDHPIEREGLRHVIAEQPDLLLVGCIPLALEDLRSFDGEADIVLLDLHSDSDRALHYFPSFVAAAGGARVMVLIGPGKEEICRSLALYGAMGAVPRDREVETLVKAMRKVHAGEVWFDRALVAGLIRRIAQPQRSVDAEAARRIATLTRREREVIQLLGSGLNPETLAERLHISETTVRHHLSSILEKLEVRDRFDLVFYAYRWGLAVPPRCLEGDD